MKFINRFKYAEHKFFCVCIDVYKIYERDDFDEIFESLSNLKNTKLKIKNILFENMKILRKILISNKIII